MSGPPGHVFVTRGDLTGLACDGWLLPTDVTGWVEAPWRETLSTVSSFPPGWGDDGVRVGRLPERERPNGGPEPWPTNMGGSHSTPTEWFIEGARQFVIEAATAYDRAAAAHGRDRPLVGLPVVGTGAGGAGRVKGELIGDLLAALCEVVASRRVDVVLVTRDAQDFAAAQSARRQLAAAGSRLWPELDADLSLAARELADSALAARLVLFLGAGVGVGAGLPMWEQLLDRLADDAGMTRGERDAMAIALTVTDRARIIERRLSEGGIELGDAVAHRLRATRCSLLHQLLASLPIREAVTMNYDTLYETASAEAGRRLAVLPYEPAADRDGWLLKMHGTLDRPDDIVLTREDYLRYAERRAALAGIVQALLITRHMLFVGFSLADDNFHRIAHDVRRAVGADSRTSPFGTALLLVEDPLLEELWRGDIQCLSMGSPSPTGDAAAARRLEVFLDYLLYLASPNSDHLLDPAYEGILSSDERALREHLERFIAGVPPDARAAHAWTGVEAMLKELGLGEGPA